MEPSENEKRYARNRRIIWTAILQIIRTAEYIFDKHPSSLSANVDNLLASLAVQKVGDEQMALSMTYGDPSCLVLLCATGTDMHPVLTCVFGDSEPVSIEFRYEDSRNKDPYDEFRVLFAKFLGDLE